MITLRHESEKCGAAGTENMDPNLIMAESGRTLNSLGTVESFIVSENPLSGEEELTWTSSSMRVKKGVKGPLKICYCSAVAAKCGAEGTMSVHAGMLEIRGASKGDVKLVGT